MTVALNRVQVNTATTGAGTVTLGGATLSYQTFAAAGALTGQIIDYLIVEGASWEIGWGLYSSTGPTLTRNLKQSSSGSLLSLGGAAVLSVIADAAAAQRIDGERVRPYVADFTWQNQSTSTATDGVGGLILTSNGNGTINLLEKNTPASTFNCYVNLACPCVKPGNGWVGIVVRNSTTGKAVSFCKYLTTINFLACYRYTNLTTYSASGASATVGQLYDWLRLEVTATTINLYQSSNGLDFLTPLVSETIATFIGSFDKVGIATNLAATGSSIISSFSFSPPL